MNLSPLSRVIDRPIGYVVDSTRIVGEWSGNRWEDVPRKAALYVNDRRDIRERIESGELVARVWKRKNGRSSRISAWLWDSPRGNPHRLYHLENDLDHVPISLRFATLLEFVQMVRDAGANVGSPSGMMGSIERATIPKTVSVPRDFGVPADTLWRGSRIERRSGIVAHFGPSNLWDMPNAYPMRLASLRVPSRWREYRWRPRVPLPDDEEGIATALVVLPDYVLGPIPEVTTLMHAKFPREGMLQGTWSIEELRSAQESGARVFPYRVWIGTNYARPWEQWGSVIRDMRKAASKYARPLIKRASVQYVGSIAADGEIWYRRHRGPLEFDTWTNGEKQTPRALAVHGLVTARVRTDLFREALYPWGPAFVSCHTDGVILMDESPIVVGAHSDDWRVKRKMSEVIVLDPQRYAWRDYGGDWHYVFAGLPEPAIAPLFWRSWENRLKMRGADADAIMMPVGSRRREWGVGKESGNTS